MPFFAFDYFIVAYAYFIFYFMPRSRLFLRRHAYYASVYFAFFILLRRLPDAAWFRVIEIIATATPRHAAACFAAPAFSLFFFFSPNSRDAFAAYFDATLLITVC